ncbi:protein kinase [Telmatobacter sp. DSM 110680]|uniref:Protein kinase n=1 Tax=Telmatobacter sp. DSM 110680 TaxID=3036704 RepID=A0AAU7DFE5_9BACT
MDLATERFLRIEAIFQEAIEAPEKVRDLLIEVQCKGDSQLMSEVRLLLEACKAAEQVDETWRSEAGTRGVDSLSLRRVGPYEIDKLLGRGGMGAVYLAHRADGQFEQEVAVKLIDLPLATALFRERFRQERQILAELQHPYIARLLDGGVTSEGDLYLVMEYVDGRPIHQYCNERQLSLSERLGLFLHICEAVQFAHQHFVVHRDLKPDNILVAPDGTPRLLDFGTAKLISPTIDRLDRTLTREGYSSFTPQYASPEQILGRTITAATDTYSLGVLLYYLITCALPYELKELTLEEMIRVICETPPRRPEHQAGSHKKIDVDLEAILMKALRKEPQDRYRSAELLASDIRAYMARQPVAARKGGFRYRAGKFIRRNSVLLLVGSFLAISLLAGITGILWQSHQTNIQKRKAEARSADLRQLSNSLLSELDQAIRDLPGSTGAQKLLVSRVLDHLDRMAADARDDRQTQLDLASAYIQIGQVQGDGYFQNMGDTPGALSDFDKAIAIANSLSMLDRKDREALRVLALALRSRSETLFRAGRTPEAVPLIRQATSAFDILTADSNASASLLAEAANAYGVMGDELGQPMIGSLNDVYGAVAAYRTDLSLVIRARKTDASVARTLRVAAIASMRIGEIEMDTDPVQALRDLDVALQFLDAMPKGEQASFGSARTRSAVLHRQAISLNELGRYDEAARLFDQVYQADLKRQSADPLDTRLLEDLIGDLSDEADGYEYAADPALARNPADRPRNLRMAASLYAKAIPLAEKFLRQEPANENLQETLAELILDVDSLHFALHSPGETKHQEKDQLAILRRLAHDTADPFMLYAVANVFLRVEPRSLRDPQFTLHCAQGSVERSFGTIPAMQLALAKAYRVAGQTARSREEAGKGLAILPPQRPNEPKPRLRKLLEIEAR